ncbi:MAG: hypothetical protein M5U08_04240 [Burkholderiales bacterium]|nr:hypothetical protein [Burkholderiales bacterium]
MDQAAGERGIGLYDPGDCGHRCVLAPHEIRQFERDTARRGQRMKSGDHLGETSHDAQRSAQIRPIASANARDAIT